MSDHRLVVPDSGFVPRSEPVGEQLPRFVHAPEWSQ